MNPNLHWLSDPQVYRVNRLDAHSDHVCYRNESEAASGNSSLRQSLDGEWLFSYAENAESCQAAFWADGADLSAFKPITVPAHIEIQGYGSNQYINKLYPWDGISDVLPPEVDMSHNGVVSYVRFFTVNKSLSDCRVCISFQGVATAMYLWCNGKFVGYSEDSFAPAEFDLSDYLIAGENRICVQVFQRSSASWIEDQDFFRLSGIFRSVFLFGKPDIYVDDIWLKAVLNKDNCTASLFPQLRLSGDVSGLTVSCRIQGLAGECVWSGMLERTDGSQKITLDNIRPWSHEDPYLYNVIIKVRNGKGTEIVVPYSVGFRRFEIVDKVMCLNGKRLVFHGVNRHEWNSRKGRAIDREDMLETIDVLRRNNINSVRTSHYPNQSLWYELCDRNGIYLIDETNLESHGSWDRQNRVMPEWNVPGSLPEWCGCVLDRANNMFQRDKNHASVLIWSCGNESYAGEVLAEMSRFFHEHDDSRPVHYEGVFNNRSYDYISDIESRMYAPPQDIRSYLESNPKKPFVLCEYMHNMGNSMGGMESYVKLEEEYPLYQGGFIWDYMDQAIPTENHRGEIYFGYGGDFADRPTDYNFCGDGLLFANGEEKPAMQEVRYWYSSKEERQAHDQENERLRSEELNLLARKNSERKSSLLRTVIGDGYIGVHGDGFRILFSRFGGGPSSLVVDGEEWLFRIPTPAFWRATTDNDIGCGFSARSAAWYAAEKFPIPSPIQILEKSEEKVSVGYSFVFSSVPGVKVEIKYTVFSTGVLRADEKYYGNENAPELPAFGLRFLTQHPVHLTKWVGLSGETTTDRYKGAKFGNYEETPHVTAHLRPQDCGTHVNTVSLRLCLDEKCRNRSLCIEQTEKSFIFSVLPNTPAELESAEHHYELPSSGHSCVSILGAARGVGGIDSWGSDVELPYRLPGNRLYECSFQVVLRT